MTSKQILNTVICAVILASEYGLCTCWQCNGGDITLHLADGGPVQQNRKHYSLNYVTIATKTSFAPPLYEYVFLFTDSTCTNSGNYPGPFLLPLSGLGMRLPLHRQVHVLHAAPLSFTMAYLQGGLQSVVDNEN